MTVRRVVVDHVLFVVEDRGASRRLSAAALAPLDYIELHVQEDGVHDGAEGLDDFSISRGAPVTSAAHIAFHARDRSAVDAFFDAAVENGTNAARRTRRLDAVLRALLRGVRDRSARQ